MGSTKTSRTELDEPEDPEHQEGEDFSKKGTIEAQSAKEIEKSLSHNSFHGRGPGRLWESVSTPVQALVQTLSLQAVVVVEVGRGEGWREG